MAGSSLGDLIVTVGARIDGFQEAMKEIQDQLNQLGQKSEEASEQVEGGFSGLIAGIREHAEEFKEHCESMAKAGLALVLVGNELSEHLTEPLKELGEEALHAAANTEQLETVFRTLTGSAENANEMVETLHKFAGNTVLGLGTAEQGAQRLMAFGFAAKDVVPILNALGNASNAFGHGDEGVGELIGQLGRIRSQGSLTQRNLRGLNQFGGTSALASGMGISEAEVKDKAKTGIPEAEAISALLSGFQMKFGNVMSDQLSTFNGQMANIKNKIELTLDEIGQALLPIAKTIAGVLSDVLDIIKELAKWFATLPEPIQLAVVGFVALLGVIGPIIVLIGGFILAISAIGASLAGVIAIVATVIGVLAEFGIWIAMHWEGIKAGAEHVWDGVKDIWNATIGAAIDWVKDKMGFLFDWASAGWNGFKNGIVGAWEAIKEAVTSAWDWIESHVVGPMMAWLEKIPGITKGLQEIKGAGEAFEQAEKESKDKKQLQGDLDAMTGGGKVHIADPQEAFKEKHAAAIKEAAERMDRLKEAYKEGKITLDQLNQAQANYNALVAQKGPASDAENAAKSKTKIDRNALDALTAAHAHQEAMLSLQKAQVDHAFQMSQITGTDKVGLDPEDLAQQEIDAGQKRLDALNAIALKERDATLAELDAKLKLYKGDQDGYQKILGEKTAAEDKYQAELQKNRNQQEQIVKKANDEIEKDDLRSIEEDLKAQAEHDRAVLALQQAVFASKMKAAEESRQYDDAIAQYRLEKGEITERQYLKIVQDELDAAYDAELADIARERALIEQMLESGDINQDQADKKNQALDTRANSATNKYKLDSVKNSMDQDKSTYNQWFKPVESSFASGITSMIEGTKSFRQAFVQMGKDILGAWISNLAQMAARWVTHKLMELTLHTTVEQAKTVATTTGEATRNQVSLMYHLKAMVRHAAEAAGGAFHAVVGIPIVGPILAPIAAAAAFAGVMAFSAVTAEHGAVLPDHNTVAFLHPREMVLPRHLSEGLQRMLSGGPPSAPSIPSGSMNSSTLQGIRQGAAAGAVHNWGGISMHITNSSNEPLSGPKLFDSFMGEVRRRNLKMA